MWSENVVNLTKQKKLFEEFLEDIKDRYDLIIADDINLIFDSDSINFENVLKIAQTDFSLTPEIVFLSPLSTPRQLQISQNVLNNYNEIVSNFKRYLLIFNHIRHSFTDAKKEEAISEEVIKEFNEILRENQNGASFYVTSFVKNEKQYNVMITVVSFGSAKKSTVDMCYTVVNEQGEKRNIHFYTVTKSDFAKDCAEHLLHAKVLHISQEDLENKTISL